MGHHYVLEILSRIVDISLKMISCFSPLIIYGAKNPISFRYLNDKISARAMLQLTVLQDLKRLLQISCR